MFEMRLLALGISREIKYILLKKNTCSDTCEQQQQNQFQQPLMGLGLATTDPHRSPNVLESAMLKPIEKRSIDVGEVHSLGSCTESLGFESSDQILKNHENDIYDHQICRRRIMKAEGRGKVRSFPPPLPSLNRNGKPSFYLRPIRKDGRLELTQVRIHRSEILHASRHNGRLTLRLVPDQDQDQEEEEDEEIEKAQHTYGDWKFNTVAGSEALRCHEMVNHHHHVHVHGNLGICGISIV
ncbi:hypothetical protein VNO78_18411 [Psophocarpus tetragonolobus]|uniref:FAF domain-containing protein n=1 Tax=Psophocarpus tetragonolobus TaxID=3891 RepID=A0AAN9XM01_PSOTE